jgi:hypothetical protein
VGTQDELIRLILDATAGIAGTCTGADGGHSNRYHKFSNGNFMYSHDLEVIIDGVWIDEWIY